MAPSVGSTRISPEYVYRPRAATGGGVVGRADQQGVPMDRDGSAEMVDERRVDRPHLGHLAPSSRSSTVAVEDIDRSLSISLSCNAYDDRAAGGGNSPPELERSCRIPRDQL